MSRSRFIELFKIVFNRQIVPNLRATLERGEPVRDRIVHGKHWTQAEARKCLVDAFEFARGFNEFVYSIARFRPFSDLRGFKGRKQSLSKQTTRWVLRGMGFPKEGSS